MDNNLMSKLQDILGTKEGQEQLKNIQSMFSNSNTSSDIPSQPQPSSQSQPQQGGGGLDMSAIASLLSSLGGGNSQTDTQSNPTQSQQTNTSPPQGGGFDMSALAGMLGSMGGGSGASDGDGFGMPNIDINMIMKLQQVFKSMNVNDKNTQLLVALKPHFSDKRKAKVDQAMSMMRLMSMLPALKESGIFSGL